MPWPTAIVVSVALVVIGALSVIGSDTSDLMLIVVSVLGGMGVSELRAVKDNTNGSNTRLMEELAATRELLARATVPPAPPEE